MIYDDCICVFFFIFFCLKYHECKEETKSVIIITIFPSFVQLIFIHIYDDCKQLQQKISTPALERNIAAMFCRRAIAQENWPFY